MALPRAVGVALAERLAVMPAVVVTGARLSDETTWVTGAIWMRTARSLRLSSACGFSPDLA